MSTSILEKYERAAEMAQFQYTNTGYRNDMVIAHWIEDSDRFFYVAQTEAGKVGADA